MVELPGFANKLKLRSKRKKRVKDDTKVFTPSIEKKNVAIKKTIGDFPRGTVVKNPPANAGDTGSSPGPGRSHMPQSN